MSERDNPLLRWARLKQAARAAEEIEATPVHVAPPATAVPIEPASLPSIESIAADTDIVAFLRSGVPAELTKAALRRAWTSDPAIRDFIGIAENQWDFNDPNGVPGFGQLEVAESGRDVLAEISTRIERLPNTLEDLTVPVEPSPANQEEQLFDGRGGSDELFLTEPGTPLHGIPAIEEDQNTPATAKTGKRRPHGSALPVPCSVKLG